MSQALANHKGTVQSGLTMATSGTIRAVYPSQFQPNYTHWPHSKKVKICESDHKTIMERVRVNLSKWIKGRLSKRNKMATRMQQYEKGPH